MIEKILWNHGWKFRKYPLGTVPDEIRAEEMTQVSLPHDWLIYQGQDLYEDGSGWYLKEFSLKLDPELCYELYFEGVYMDSTLYVNGEEAFSWKYGYTSFTCDITRYLRDGENRVMVGVQHRAPNSRWYSGAGIYRDVYLISKPKVGFVTDSLYLHGEPDPGQVSSPVMCSEQLRGRDWILSCSVEVGGMETIPEGEWEQYRIGGRYWRGGRAWSIPAVSLTKALAAGRALWNTPEGRKHREDPATVSSGWEVALNAVVSAPDLWSVREPALYTMEVWLESYGGDKTGEAQILDRVESSFGFRVYTFTAEDGLLVNGEYFKIRGVCEHHDLGALGAAYHHGAMVRKLQTLREMGVNAIRTAHNPPAPDVLDLCDRMGFLVMDEAFDMWERPKTTYDYARFFPQWQSRDVNHWIRRDRNHPCILLWSIGNEIYDTHADRRGQEISELLMEEVHAHDPLRNGQVTIGSNWMTWENGQKCADIVKYAGYNYTERLYDEHHAKYPDWHIYGSETSSTVQSRGVYHFPYGQVLLADDDEQCSSLGNSTTGWGAVNSEYCIIAERDHRFSLGQFLWTGWDYIGEPTPYHTRNSYFGQIDLAGFPKDSFYLYRGSWTSPEQTPFVHLFPYWNWNPGQIIDVRVASNLPMIELFLNGRSLGEQRIDHAHGNKLTADWQVPFEPGCLEAVGYDARHVELARDSRHSYGEPARLLLRSWAKGAVSGDGGDAFPWDLRDGVVGTDMTERVPLQRNGFLDYITILAVDASGYPVEDANAMVHVMVSGEGKLAGLDNGDSTDEEEYKGHWKRLFGGRMVAVVRAAQAGQIKVHVSCQGLPDAELNLNLTEEDLGYSENSSQNSYEKAGEVSWEKFLDTQPDLKTVPWVRQIVLNVDGEHGFHPDRSKVRVSAQILPSEADTPENRGSLIWNSVNDKAVDSPMSRIFEVSEDGREAVVEAYGDGSCRVRCMTKNGCRQVKVMSQIELIAEGLGEVLQDPYGFIPGAMWTYSEGELGNGNEKGVSTARGKHSVVGFEHVDFGEFGSDEIFLPVFELAGEPTPIQIWQGIPGEASAELLIEYIYHKPSIWNTYQPVSIRLPHRIKGVRTICFAVDTKIHIKGFSFTRPEKAYTILWGEDCDALYGDTFTRQGKQILGIGNNVTVEFTEMEFGEDGARRIVICGRTGGPNNTIHLLYAGEDQEREILEFPGSEEFREVSFQIARVRGKKTVRLVFLPGCCFDLNYIRFEK